MQRVCIISTQEPAIRNILHHHFRAPAIFCISDVYFTLTVIQINLVAPSLHVTIYWDQASLKASLTPNCRLMAHVFKTANELV